MRSPITTILTALCLSACVSGQQAESKAFPREGTPAQRAKKDPLEGKAPPELRVADWLNTDGKPLQLPKLRGKVVLLDFWGVW